MNGIGNSKVAIIKSTIKRNSDCFTDWDWKFIGKDKLPNIDENVLWMYENGIITHASIDKDDDSSTINQFLKGSEMTGPIVAYVKPIYPKGF